MSIVQRFVLLDKYCFQSDMGREDKDKKRKNRHVAWSFPFMKSCRTHLLNGGTVPNYQIANYLVSYDVSFVPCVKLMNAADNIWSAENTWVAIGSSYVPSFSIDKESQNERGYSRCKSSFFVRFVLLKSLWMLESPFDIFPFASTVVQNICSFCSGVGLTQCFPVIKHFSKDSIFTI